MSALLWLVFFFLFASIHDTLFSPSLFLRSWYNGLQFLIECHQLRIEMTRAREKTTNERLLPFTSHKQLTRMLSSTDRLSLGGFQMIHSHSCYRCNDIRMEAHFFGLSENSTQKWTSRTAWVEFPCKPFWNVSLEFQTLRNEFTPIRQTLDKLYSSREQSMPVCANSDSFCVHTSFSVLTRVLWQSIDSWTGSHIVEQMTVTLLPIEARIKYRPIRHHPWLSETQCECSSRSIQHEWNFPTPHRSTVGFTAFKYPDYCRRLKIIREKSFEKVSFLPFF